MLLVALVNFLITRSFVLSEALEIDDGLFQFHELNQLFVSSRLVKLTFDLFTLTVDRTKGRKVKFGVAVENLEDKA